MCHSLPRPAGQVWLYPPSLCSMLRPKRCRGVACRARMRRRGKERSKLDCPPRCVEVREHPHAQTLASCALLPLTCTCLPPSPRNGHVQCVAILIDAGADVNSMDMHKSTPLHNACCRCASHPSCPARRAPHPCVMWSPIPPPCPFFCPSPRSPLLSSPCHTCDVCRRLNKATFAVVSRLC